MSAREVSARAICRSRCVNRAHPCDQDSTGACLPEACRLWDVLWGADVDASFAALDAAGPSEAMQQAGVNAMAALGYVAANESEVTAIWRAMLAAAAKGGER